MGSNYTIFWTDEAIRNFENIVRYLGREWSNKEISHFKDVLNKRLSLIQKYPELFPASSKAPNLRKAVLSKHNSVFYKIADKEIFILHLFDNRQNPNIL